MSWDNQLNSSKNSSLNKYELKPNISERVRVEPGSTSSADARGLQSSEGVVGRQTPPFEVIYEK